MKKLTDPNFRYVPADRTNIRKTFEKERRRLAELEDQKQQKVTPIKRETK